MKKFNIKTIIPLSMSLLMAAKLAVPMAVSGQTIANDVYVYQFLTEELGLNHAAASGLMANIYKESTFIPTASCVDINGRISYGIMQWNGPRFEQLKSFCEARGYGYDTLEGQLAYLQNDLTGAYSGYYDYLLTGTPDTAEGAYEAAYFWAAEYEVCSSRYFEQRAELARDFYYPEFMEYAPVTAEMMGEELFVRLTNRGTGLALTESGKSVAFAKPGEDGQVWRFTRTGTCTYEAVNAKTGKKLSPDGEEYLWHFVESGDGYVIEAESTGQVISAGDDGTVKLLDNVNSSMQQFTLEEHIPAKASAELWAYYEAAPSVTEFSWEPAEGADSYRLKIFSGSSADGTPIRVVDDIKETSCKESLAAGEYAAVVESENECGFTASDPVRFTIVKQEVVDLGEEFLAKLSWNDEQQYLTVADSSNVKSASVDYETDQLWRFVRSDDGSYEISSYDDKKALAVDNERMAALAPEKMDKNRWVIYGDEERGYILEAAEKTLVLSAAEESSYELREFSEVMGQRFDIADYILEKPVISADASGGVLEPVTFTWTPADCVDGYTLRVMDDNGDVAATLKIRDNDTEADITLREGTYSAEVSAISTVTGERTVSERTEFAVKKLPERPAADLEISANPMELSFSWERSETADRYSYRITDAATGKIVQQKRSVKGSSDKAVLDAGTYILTITAWNDEGFVTSEDTRVTVREDDDGAGVVSIKSVLAAKKQKLDR